MKTTGNLGLKKPEGTDLVDITDLNGNMDILDNAVTGKVDKVTGKQLSTNDYTAAEKTKLAGIATGANNYTHPNHTGDVTSTGDGVTAIAAGVIVDSDVNANAGIKFSKINAAGSIMDSDINDEAYINMLKIGTGKINNATLDQLYGVTAPIQGQLNERVKQTTASITYYVRSDGNDNNTGLSNTAGAAFKTIAKAVSMLPKIGEHSRSIKIAAGTYAEAIDLKGFGGSGPIEIASLGTLASGVTNVQRVNVVGCSSQITLIGITSTATTDNAFDVIACTWVWLSNCYALSGGGGTTYGVCAYGSNVIVSNGIYSNKGGAIWSRNSSNVFATNIQGANNSIGYLATEGSKIGLSANTLTAVLLSDAKQGGLILGDPRESSIPLQTTADITYYVRTDGSDSNTGLANTAGGSFKTINKAISMIPQIVNHVVSINIAAGTYSNEEIKIAGRSGGGEIKLIGALTLTNTHVVYGISLVRNTCRIGVTGLVFSRPTPNSIFSCFEAVFQSCTVTSAVSDGGFFVDSSKAYFTGCSVSNRNPAFQAHTNSEVLLQQCSGSGNGYAVTAAYGGKIVMDSCTITSTNKYSAYAGGIVLDNGAGIVNPWGDNTLTSRSMISAWYTLPQSFVANTWTKVMFNQEVFDNLGEYNPTLHRFTAAKPGAYLVSASLNPNSPGANATCTLSVWVSGTRVKDFGYSQTAGTSSTSYQGTVAVRLAAGDYVEIYAYTNLNMTGNGGGAYQYLDVVQIA
ncbi:hypothetical protein [Paenibacillus sp. FSL F4-0243]|uniref:hypothetical protein n=1 Tax=Paenibacillus sp. FSL F4-0243 TaxID=2954732 RepID=UPI0030DD7DEC